MEKYYKVAEKQLINLFVASMKLQALENGGVDNWEWYNDSLENYLKEELKSLSIIDPADYHTIINECGEDYDLYTIASVYVKNHQEGLIENKNFNF